MHDDVRGNSPLPPETGADDETAGSGCCPAMFFHSKAITMS
jgi:hypothetical protein